MKMSINRPPFTTEQKNKVLSRLLGPDAFMKDVMIMRASRIAMLAVLCFACIAGCATAPTPQLMAGKVLQVPPQAASGAPIVSCSITKAAVVVEGKRTEVQADSPRSRDLQVAVQEFLTEIVKVHNLQQPPAGQAAGPAYAMEMTVEDRNAGLKGSDAAKAFATGFFTLGLAGHVVKYNLEYVSAVQLETKRADGVMRSYSSQANVTGKLDANRNAVPQHLAIMHEGTAQCLSKLLEQIKNDVDYWKNP